MNSENAPPAFFNGHAVQSVGAIHGYAKGSAVYHQGDQADYWYVVRDGVLRTCRFRADGNRQLTGFYFAGDIIGFDSERYLSTAEAVTNARLESYAAHAAPVSTDQLERALANANRYIMLLGHRTAAERIAAFLIGLPRNGNHIPVPMSRSDIADYLGMTIHTISRALSDLFRRAVLRPEGRHSIWITDLAALALLSGEDPAALHIPKETELCLHH